MISGLVSAGSAASIFCSGPLHTFLPACASPTEAFLHQHSALVRQDLFISGIYAGGFGGHRDLMGENFGDVGGVMPL